MIHDKYFDRNRVPVASGSRVAIQHSSGGYGETRRVIGTIESIDKWYGVSIRLDASTRPFWTYSKFGSTEYRGGSTYYVAGAFKLVDGVPVGYDKFEDFEHGHESFLMAIEPECDFAVGTLEIPASEVIGLGVCVECKRDLDAPRTTTDDNCGHAPNCPVR